MKPAYLITGDDTAKIEAAIERLRKRAEAAGGPGALEVLRGDGGTRPADPADVAASTGMLSLVGGHRYVVARHAEQWNAAQTKAVAAVLDDLPPELTLVLVGFEGADKRSAKVGKPIVDAIKTVGEILEYKAPKSGQLPGWIQGEADKRGFSIDQHAAALLVERMGESTVRLGNELDRLALWAGPGGEVGETELEQMVADTSEDAIWALADAVVEGNRVKAMIAAERIAEAGDSPAPMLVIAARKLRESARAAAIVADGGGENEIRAELKIHPYAAKLLAQRVRRANPARLRRAACAIADIEWWTRGGADYDPDTALTLGIRRATA